MSTHATIAISKGSTINSIYVYSDGYLSYIVPILLNHYNTTEQVNELVSLGDCSFIGSKIKGSETHSFLEPDHDTTIAYHRDGGEDLNIKTFEITTNNLNHILSSLHKGVNYVYIFNTSDNTWYIHQNDLLIKLIEYFPASKLIKS